MTEQAQENQFEELKTDLEKSVEIFDDKMQDVWSTALTPRERLDLDTWAEQNAILSAENSAEPGKWKSKPYQRGMMNAITDPAVEMISVIKSARVGYTKILDHAIGYFIDQDPAPMLMVQPTVEDAEDYSKSQVKPMLEDTPCLRGKIKDDTETIVKKEFTGGSLRMIGANSPRGFRRITVRLVMFDEVDGYPVQGAGTEGDQIKLGIKRTDTFWNRKIILGSTPTVKGASRIEASYDKSDQRKYHVPCPFCKEKQVLKFGGPFEAYGLKWPKDEPHNAYYECEHCHEAIEEKHKEWMLENGEWIADKPFAGHAGFHIWAAYSTFPNAAWGKIVQEFLEAKGDPLLLQVFINTVLGESWEHMGSDTTPKHELMARRELYDAEVPEGVVLLTAGVDVQDNRLEFEITGWGKNEESWMIRYGIIDGDPAQPAVWRKLDAELVKQRKYADGRKIRVAATCIDSGGHHTQKAYQFCRERAGRNIYAIKGRSERKGERHPVWPRTPSRKGSNTWYLLGGNASRDVVYSRLALEEPGAGYCHFPDWVTEEYFEQLTAETLVVEQTSGVRYTTWKTKRNTRNEAADCRVYSYGALCALQSLGVNINAFADKLKALQQQKALQEPKKKKVEKNPNNERRSVVKSKGRKVKSSFMSK